MKSKTVLLFLFLLVATVGQAQLIHVSGSKAIGLNGGFIKDGYNISTRFSLYQKSNITYRASIDFEHVNLSLSKANIVYANPEFMYTFFFYGERLYFSGKAGLLSGAEFISNSALDRKKNQFFVGENVGLCAEYYVSNLIMLNLDIDQRFFQLSKVGNSSFIIKLGVNYNF